MRKRIRILKVGVFALVAVALLATPVLALITHADWVIVTGRFFAEDVATIGKTSGGTYNGNWVFGNSDQFPTLNVRSGFTPLWTFSGNANPASGVIGTIDLKKEGGVFMFRDIPGVPILTIDEDGFVGILDISPSVALDVNGTASVEILQITGGADLAEGFRVDALGSELKPGMVVSIHTEKPGEMVLSSKAYESTVAGVISGAGGLSAGLQLGDIEMTKSGEFQPVALTGRVYVWADASHGAIKPGDMLTTSGANLGFAAKVADFQRAHGTVIGKAMTPLQGEEGLVLVLVALQ